MKQTKNILTKKNITIFIIAMLMLFMVGRIIITNNSVKIFDEYIKTDLIVYENYNTFLSESDASNISEVELSNEEFLYYKKISGVNENLSGEATSEETSEKLVSEIYFKTDNPRKETLKEELLLKGITVREKVATSQSSSGILVSLLIAGFLITFFYISKGKKQGAFEKSACEVAENNTNSKNVDFSSVAGNEEAKESLMDVVDFLRYPDKYKKYGARMPKGIIFYGPPGTGKTLMAKALAMEAGVPFFSVSGSDFVEMYVGVGASRIRDLFKKAKEKNKAVIFIDEIDALGKKRMNNKEGGNEERDQTLNALLTEMSGFKENDGIVVIAATNRVDILDEALLRPGRFDRQIEISLPDKDARYKILNVHKNGKPISDDVNLEKLAENTVYFSGAMLENLLNEAAINSAKENEDAISNESIEKAYYTILVGAEKKNKSSMKEDDKKVIAVHESGHTIVTKLLKPNGKISKVSILPSVKGAGGFTASLPDDKMFTSKKDILNQIKILLAGRCAEEIMLGKENITTGASNDFERVSQITKEYITKFGMSDDAILYFEDTKNNEKIKEEYENIISNSYDETKKLITDNRKTFERIVESLLIKESLNDDEINELIANK